MKNRWLLNGILFLILVVLALIIWQKPTEDVSTPKISQLSSDDIRTINLYRPEKADIRLEKKDKHWEITAPYSAIATASKITLLLTLLNEPVKSEYSAEGKDLAQFGLGPGQNSIQFNEESRIRFGISHPVSYDRYLLQDDKIRLIADTVSTAIKADVASFLSTQLVPKGSQIRNIILPDDYTLADDTIANWQLSSAIEVFDWNKEEQPSQGTVILELSDGQKIIYEILESSPEIWLGNAELNAKYQIAEESTQDLLPKQ